MLAMRFLAKELDRAAGAVFPTSHLYLGYLLLGYLPHLSHAVHEVFQPWSKTGQLIAVVILLLGTYSHCTKAVFSLATYLISAMLAMRFIAKKQDRAAVVVLLVSPPAHVSSLATSLI